jgi:uncharacterized protein YjdB
MNRSFVVSITNSIRILALNVLMLFCALQSFGQATVTATGAGPGPTAYGTLQAAFAQINAGTHTGAITITIGAAGTTETATALLNPNILPANYTSVTIKPAVGATPTITGAFNAAIIHLFGSSNVTIDGSNTVGGTTRDLSIRSTYALGGGVTAGVRLGSAATVGVSNINIRNCNIRCGGTGSGMCITSGSGTAIYGIGTLSHTNVTIQNNSLQDAQVGAYGYGPNAPALDAGWVVTGNDCTNVGFAGIHINNGSNNSITNNNITNVVPPATVVGRASGIVISFTANNTTISGNKINNVAQPAAGWGASGIYIDCYNTSTGANIFNNFIANATAPGSATIPLNGHGIMMDLGNGMNMYHNSVHQSTNSSGAPTTAAICINPFAGAPGPVGPIPNAAVNLRDNLLTNTQTTGNRYGIYCVSPNTIFASIDYNDYTGATALGNIGGVNRVNIAQIQAGFGSNLNSITVAPTYVSASDLHLQLIAANIPLNAGTPIAVPPITTDIDGGTRNPTTPTIGAHEMLSKITYTPLTNTCSDANITLNPVVIESVVGVPTAGPVIPRIYFRKGAGPWFSNPGSLVSGSATNGTWSFVITPSSMGGVVAGDVVSYYVIAQTTGGVIFANASTGLVAVDVNTVTTHPTTPNTYTVNAVTLTGLVTSASVCFNPAAVSTPSYAYTGTTGTPNQYSLTWSPSGPTDVAAYAALPGSPINVNVPAATPAFNYAGALTIRNSTTTCTKVYPITLTVNPLPATITGPGAVCMTYSITLTSTSTGGTWTSTAPGIATVGLTTGVVTGVSGGTTSIIYTLPTTCSTFAMVNVITPPPAITGTFQGCPGFTTTLINTSTGGSWSSSTPSVATIDAATGIVTGMSPGTATIFYTVTGCAAVSAVFTVNPIPAPITGTLYACETFSDTLFTTSTGGTWSSSNTAVASIGSTTGIFGGISGGTAVITYKFTSTGCVNTNTVSIFPAAGPITGGPVICQGLSIALGNSVAGGTWTSSAPGIISVVTATGVVTANSPTGTAIISYILGTGCSTAIVMTVSTAPTAIAGSNVICSGNTILFSNGTGGGTWTSSNTATATIGSTSGLMNALAGGTTTISYNTLACNPAIYNVTVNQTPPPITGGITICNGASTTTLFNATPGGVWTLSGPASISPTGVVTGLAVGGTYVATYTMPNACFVKAPIIVDTLPAPITGPDSVCMGRTVTLSTASTGGLWSSANALIASVVSTSGSVTGVNFGATTITYASLSGCYRTKPFLVSTPALASVTVTRTPAHDTICAGVPVTFRAHHVNGGLDPSYQWQIFGVNIGPDDSVYTYIPTHGDVISCYMTNSLDICALPSPAYVNIPINIYPNVIPMVNITTTANDSINYIGQVVTFFAEVTSGGGAPLYQWFVDGEQISGATNNVFVRTVYDNDTVYCRVNGNPPCELGSIGNSNAIVVYGDWLSVKGTAGLAEGSIMSLFPNPNKGTFTLTGTLASGATQDLNIDVLNVLGQVVYSGKTTAKNGNLNHEVVLKKGLAAGTYVLRVNSGTDNKVFHFVIGE